MSSDPDSLRRGQACITCRRRKTRCDGARPVCNKCSRTTRPQDCEYTDNFGYTRAEQLEHYLAQLEARLRELQLPHESRAPVLLHDPHSTMPGTPVARHPSTSSRSSSRLDLLQVQQLVSAFLKHADQLGFVLNVDRFFTRMVASSTAARPAPCLMNVICLWGARLLSAMPNAPFDATMEPLLLSDVLNSISPTLLGNSHTRSQQYRDALQTEALLALYFFCTGRYTEGKYHLGASMSIVLFLGLHKFSASPETSSVPPSLRAGTSVPGAAAEPMDLVTRGEWIRLFWIVFNLDRCWSVALNVPPAFSDQNSETLRIDTEWPLEMGAYTQPLTHPPRVYRATVNVFLAQPTPDVSAGQLLCMRAKAAILFERATSVMSACSNGAPPSPPVARAITSLDRTISLFCASLHAQRPPQHVYRAARTSYIVASTLVHAATIQLHCPFYDTLPASHTRCIASARAAAALAVSIDLAGDVEEAVPFDPIIGVAWLSVLRILRRECEREGSDAYALLEAVLNAMAHIGNVFTVFSLNLRA